MILKLLEKDPAKRPADADEVLSLLAAVDPEERPAPRSEGHVLERLARGVFVGREKELERLRSSFDEALSGHGGLVMLVGEPGIGKTRTAQELETYARMRGAQVLWGRSHENSGAPAFWPWAQVGRHWGSTNDVNSLSAFVAAGGGDLARLFPELRGVAGFVEPPVMQDGAAAQFRLFDAFAGFVRTVSEQKPLVITLDDLHWADKPTLQLLQHVARELSRMRVLVVCTYRDTDLVRTHPLSEALANLNRDPGFERVVLRGLSKEETRAYIASAASLQPSSALVERVYEETEGNPFFLSEVVNLLTQEGTLASESVSDIHIPDGVREALGRRLDRVSEEATALLQVAAVVGREFTYDTLQLLHSGDDDSLLNLIEEGLEARVVEEMEQPGRYRFTHALMQETLLGELSTTRRVRLHGQVGEALERRWGDRAEEYASRLALHFSESATLTGEHAEKAFRYSVQAATTAAARFAWAEAIDRFQAALELELASEGRMLQPRFRLQFLEALMSVGDAQAALAEFDHTVTALERTGDGSGLAKAVILLGGAGAAIPSELALSACDRALAVLREPSVDRVDVLLARAGLRGGSFFINTRDEQRRPFVEEARALVVKLNLKPQSQFLRLWDAAELRLTDREGAHQRFVEEARVDDEMGSLLASVQARYIAAWTAPTFDTWTSLLLEQGEFARSRLGQTRTWSSAAGFVALATILGRGDIDAAEQILSGVSESFFLRIVADALILERRGQIGHALERLNEVSAVGSANPSSIFRSARARVLWRDGRRDDAAAEIRQARLELGAGPSFVVQRMFTLVLGIDVLLETLSPAEFNAAVDDWETFTAPLNYTSDFFWTGAYVGRLRGLRALVTGDLRLARELFEESLAGAERDRCWLELARLHENLAVVAERSGDRHLALSHLDEAAGLYRPWGSPQEVNSVVARKVVLQGLSGFDPFSSIVAVSTAVGREGPDVSLHAAADGTVTLMFSDIEGSTALNERLGDARWMEVLRAHNDLVDREVAAHGGRTVKTIGDGYMVAFPSPEAGVRCALAIQAALIPGPSPSGDGRRDAALLSGVRLRIGLHTGSAVRQGDDFFGREVNYAARVASAALGGEVLISRVLKERLGTRFAFDAGRVVALKGFEGAHRVFGVSV